MSSEPYTGRDRFEGKEEVDVLVVGAGPTGLVLSYALLKQGLRVLNIEQHTKEGQSKHGRAVIFYPRSLELLDQLGLYEELADIGFITKNSVTFRNGEKVPARGWSFIQKAIDGNTNFDHWQAIFSLAVRQFLIEECYRKHIKELDPNALYAPAKLIEYSVDNSVPEYPVKAKIETDGRVIEINAKYLVGTDGGRSTVRSLADIAFPGTTSHFKWARIDAIARTNIPDARRMSVAIESPTYGNVLWTSVDNHRTRIGFVWKHEMEEATAEIIMNEAKKAVHPFDLEFVELDWWTVYAIGQRVAERFKDGRVFLGGDAAHTHSSGAAQGMNTGLHDASNLAWKLAGVLRGLYKESLLETYEEERKKSAEQLIQIDKDVATCISGNIPAHFNAPSDADPNDYLHKVFTTNAAFTVGLGISYGANLINGRNPLAPRLNIDIGQRAPDPPLFRPGAGYPKRMLEFMPNCGKFWITVFAGDLD
ncbi:hypothetical protein M422DRAFT_179082, partial [Sphaerobolus stellatus SS14]